MSTRQIHAFAQLIDQLPLGVEESELIDGAVAENSARLLSGSFVLPFAYPSSSHLNPTTGVDGSFSGPFSLFGCSGSLETNPADRSCLHGGAAEDRHHSLSWRDQRGDGVDNGQPNLYTESSDTAGHHHSSSSLVPGEVGGDAKRNNDAVVGWSSGRREEKNLNLVNRFDMGECQEIGTPPRCSSESFKSSGLHGRHENNGDMSSSSFLGVGACAKENDSPEDHHGRSFHGRGGNGGGGDGCSFLLGGPRTEETAASTPTTSVRTPISGRCGEQGSFMCLMGPSPSSQGLETIHPQSGGRASPCDGSGGKGESGHGGGTGNAGACFSSGHHGNHLSTNIGVSTPCSSAYSSTIQQHCPSNGDSGSASPAASEHPQYYRQSVQVKTEGRRGGAEGPVAEQMCHASGPLLVKNSEPREWGSGCMLSHMNQYYPNGSLERGGEGGLLGLSPDSVCTPSNNKRAAGAGERSMYCDDGTPTTNAAASSLSTPSPGCSDHGQSNEEKQPISSYCPHDGIHISQTMLMSSSCPAAFHTSSSPSHPEQSPCHGCPPQACMASNQTMPRVSPAKQADCCRHCPSVCSSPRYPLEAADDTNRKTTEQALSSHGNRHHHSASELPHPTSKDLTMPGGATGSPMVAGNTSHGPHSSVAPQYGTGPSSCPGFGGFGDREGGGRNVCSGSGGGYTSFPCSPSSHYDVKMESHSINQRHALSNEIPHDCTDVVIAPAAFSSPAPDNTHQQCSENRLQSMTPLLSSPLASSHPPLPLESLSEGSAHFASPAGTTSSNCARGSHTSSYANPRHPASGSPSASSRLIRNCQQQGMSPYPSSAPPAPHGFSSSYNETTAGTNEICVGPPLVDGSSRSGGLGMYTTNGDQESSAPPPVPYQYGGDNLCSVYHSHHSSSLPTCTQQSSSLHPSPMNNVPPSSSPGFYGDDGRGAGGQHPHGGHLHGDVGESLSSQCLPCSPPSLQQKASGPPSTTVPPPQNNGLAGGNHPLQFHECAASSQQGPDPSSSMSCSPSSALVHRRVAVAETGTGVGGGLGASNPSLSTLPLEEKTSTVSNGPSASPRKRISCSKKKGAAARSLKKSGGGGGAGGEKETQLASTTSSDFKCDAELYLNSSDSTNNENLHQVQDVVVAGAGGCSDRCNGTASVISLGGGGGEDLTGAEMYTGSSCIDQRRVKAEENRDEDTTTNSSATVPQWSSVVGRSQRGEQNNLSANRSKSSWSCVSGAVVEPSSSPLLYRVSFLENGE